jgi:insertion element IS1 protein InsB
MGHKISHMITQTLTQVCRSCGSTDIVKNGTNKCGSQQYHCKTCGVYRVMTPKERHSSWTKGLVLRLLLERISLRGIGRVIGMWHGTILRWVQRWVKNLPRLSQTLLPAQAGDVLELDEVWSFVGEKQEQRWLWTAMCRRTRQIVAYAIGDRTQVTCRKLYERLPHGYRDCISFVDGWEAYQLTFPSSRLTVFPSSRGPTNHMERWYNTLRQRCPRYTRQTLAFSKSDTFHKFITHAFIVHYNLAIQHASLTSLP